MLDVLNLTKRYGKNLANDNITFNVDSGEIGVLIGPNGAGKSTTIKCISGLLRFNGNISICGNPNKSVEAKRCFGYISELPTPIENLTVYEHMEFMGRAYRVENWQEKAEKLLTRFEMDDKKNKLGMELSKGMQQKLSICCAFLHEPKVILMDEPLIGLDPHAIKELKAMLLEKRNEGCAILVSTHMLDSVHDLWDKALIMMDGKIAAIRTRKEIESTGEDLEELFFSITEGDRAGGDNE